MMITLFLMANWVMVSFPLAAGDAEPGAKEAVAKCINAMGGIGSFRNVKTLSYHSWSHTILRTVSASDSLPALFSYESKDVVLRPQAQIVSEKATWQWTETAASSVSESLVTPEGGFIERDNKRTSVSADRFYGAVDLLSANPVSALLAAYESTNLQLTQKTPQTYEISFLQMVYGQKIQTRLGIDRQSYRLQWAEIKHSYPGDLYNSIWGEIRKRFDYSNFVLDASGLLFPAKWKVSTNDLEDGQISLVNVRVNSNGGPDPELAAEFKNSFSTFLELSPSDLAKRNFDGKEHVGVNDGVTMLPGKERAYNTLVVKQDKGIVIVEGPYSNANSELVMEYARNTYPNSPIVGVVSTDYFTFHLAGLPIYAKAGVPLYVLDANVDRVLRVFSAQAAESGVSASAAKLRVVRNRMEIGTGANRIILLPFGGASSVKMMAVYFPERKFLYCSDLYLPMPWGHDFWTEHLSEIRDLIEREHIAVQQIAGVSMPPHDWKELASLLPVRP